MPARRVVSAAAVVAVLAGLLLGVSGAASPAAPPLRGPVRIMPLGDSITGWPGCWRALLHQRLPRDRVDFVGTLPSRPCPVAHDGDHEGHSELTATDLARERTLVAWLAVTEPDVVMMQLGTNDIWRLRPTGTIIAAYSTLVGQMREANPDMKIVVAQAMPMNHKECTRCGPLVRDLNREIPGWAAGLSTRRSPITVVDLYSVIDPPADTLDGVHPFPRGDRKLADKWYPAIIATLR